MTEQLKFDGIDRPEPEDELDQKIARIREANRKHGVDHDGRDAHEDRADAQDDLGGHIPQNPERIDNNVMRSVAPGLATKQKKPFEMPGRNRGRSNTEVTPASLPEDLTPERLAANKLGINATRAAMDKDIPE